MTITSQDARDEYTATAGQTVFNYTFKIYSNTDLDVYITPAGQDADDFADLTTAYTVDSSTIGDPNGGFITLNSGANSGDLVTIVSSMPYNRTVDYQNSGDFLPDTVNGDNDRQVSQIKQVADLAARTLSFPQSLQNAQSLVLPLPEATKYLRWRNDELGLENVDLSISGAPTNASLVTYSAGNNFPGGVDRTQENKNADVISPLDFGAVGDAATDDTAAFVAMFDYLKTPGLDPTIQGSLNALASVRVDMAGKTYLISSTLDFDEMYYVTFSNGQFLADQSAPWGTTSLLSLSAPQATDVIREQRIRNIAFENIKVNGTQSVMTCVYLENTFKVSFDEGCFITGWADGGTGVRGSNVNATPKTKNTHFTMIGTELAQKELSYLQAGAGVPTSGTAVSLQTADFMLQSVTVWGCDVGFFFNGFTNGQMNDCHSFVKSTQECMVVGDNCAGLQCSNFYSDTGIVTIKSFKHTFAGGSFAAGSQVNLEAQVANETGKGLVITGALFSKVLGFTTTGPGTWATDKQLSLEACRKLDTGNLIELAGTEHLGNGRLGIVSNNDLRWIFENDNSMQPVDNGTQNIGASSKMLGAIYANSVRFNASNLRTFYGTGSPEGSVTADVGSFYMRTDGGAGTSFYVKESGTGNTGWVAK